jgi:hypothetical protein
MNPPTPLSPAWKPRQPAAGLKARIFAARRPAPEEKSFWNLLAPVTACMVLSLLVLNSGNNLAPAGLKATLMADLILSNQNYSAYASGGSQNPQNHLDSLTFESTNRSVSTTFVGFTPSTN